MTRLDDAIARERALIEMAEDEAYERSCCAAYEGDPECGDCGASLCNGCHRPIRGATVVTMDPWGGNVTGWCSEECRDGAAEKAFERSLEG